VINHLVDQKFGEKKPNMCLICLPNNYNLVFNTVKMAEEAFLKKNHMLTKEKTIRESMSQILWNSFIFEDTFSKTYMPKRKSLSSAFFKSKLKDMM